MVWGGYLEGVGRQSGRYGETDWIVLGRQSGVCGGNWMV